MTDQRLIPIKVHPQTLQGLDALKNEGDDDDDVIWRLLRFYNKVDAISLVEALVEVLERKG